MLVAAWPALARGQTKEAAPAEYLRWLEERSMLRQAERASRSISGSGVQWKYAYATPQTRQAVRRASVWLLDYAGSVIPRPDKSVVATWGEPVLWEASQDIGIDLLHTGPVNRSGGVAGRGVVNDPAVLPAERAQPRRKIAAQGHLVGRRAGVVLQCFFVGRAGQCAVVDVTSTSARKPTYATC
jgi:hypothetical protein